MRLKVLLTLAVLSTISLVGAVYMAFGVLDIASTSKTNHMTLMLNSSGGLMSTSQVTLRGIKWGGSPISRPPLQVWPSRWHSTAGIPSRWTAK
ncbi:Putative Mce family protein [Mycobacteroides abscessus]|nr:Putative Mce family protein [Mycobacteroides abscessus]